MCFNFTLDISIRKYFDCKVSLIYGHDKSIKYSHKKSIRLGKTLILINRKLYPKDISLAFLYIRVSCDPSRATQNGKYLTFYPLLLTDNDVYPFRLIDVSGSPFHQHHSNDNNRILCGILGGLVLWSRAFSCAALNTFTGTLYNSSLISPIWQTNIYSPGNNRRRGLLSVTMATGV